MHIIFLTLAILLLNAASSTLNHSSLLRKDPFNITNITISSLHLTGPKINSSGINPYQINYYNQLVDHSESGPHPRTWSHRFLVNGDYWLGAGKLGKIQYFPFLSNST